ncbi:hypothetical protein Back11_47970 [Paenibacillus baekrokdamisoli]|uniref:Uncharacterized protein n=1 Tax=Paenibacillus baekrokdamisoli TaxID=1712516 RepID=A0A3G9IYU3_9BACL|nr:S-layer homology domain-containing protein [Paenibacillus baekrokdamisoli]MBB3068618.1 hypothetical protein [Paenibacillus baekrokdamisoli]BBH23452.1 hypothetical protein Back11_47970 [Paenibacillus baekrokdamisoli]
MKNKSIMKLVSSFLLVCMLLSSVSVAFGATATTTSDIKGHWAESQINAWIEKGFIKGYSDGSFKPDNTVTRAEFIALINRSFGFTEEATISFTDVASRNWAYTEVAKAVKAGYITGFTDGTIGVNKLISRQEVAVIVDRLLKLSATASAENSFKDTKLIASWAKDAVNASVAKEILKGYPADNTFRPTNSITRAEAVVTLDRAISFDKVTYNTAGTFGPATGVETVNHDVVINTAGVTLRNMIINGKLTFAAGIGSGDAVLDNVTVKGETSVQGGGENSIHFKNSVLLTITVEKKNGIVRIVAEGTTTVAQVIVNSPVIIQETDATGSGFSNVKLSDLLPEGAKVTLKGTFDNLEVDGNKISVNIPEGSVQKVTVNTTATGLILDLGKDAKIVSLILDAVAQFLGTGTIETATLNAIAKAGTTFEKQPNKILDAGVTPTPTPPTTPTTPVNVANVMSLPALKVALADSVIKTINITGDISTTEKIIVSRAVTINGGNHTVTFTGNALGWNGNYVFQVYNVTGATVFNNIKVTGADAAILVNGSNVTLTGTVDVSVNEFGGIELGKGVGVDTQPALTITGATLVNTTEVYGQPTIWEDGVDVDRVTGGNLTKVTKGSQPQYYVTAGHSLDPVANVADLPALQGALTDSTKTTINITADISTTDKIIVSRAVIINGGNHTVSFTGNELEKWNGNYVFQVYNVTGGNQVVFNNIKVSGADAAILVNGSNVKLTGAIDVSGNEFGGIELSKGVGVTTQPILTISVGAVLTNKSEIYGQPTIWEDPSNESIATISGGATLTKITKGSQPQYYVDAEKSLDPTTVAEVENSEELKTALENLTKTTIKVTADFSTAEKIIVSRAVTINGGNHAVTFTGNAVGWNGNYVFQVYNVTGETVFKNIKVTGADAAILVNGSNVTLTGTVDVSGNEFGGIELGKGVGVNSQPLLNIAGATFTNSSEKYGQPTVWEDGVDANRVTGGTLTKVPKGSQLQYYITVGNSVDPTIV